MLIKMIHFNKSLIARDRNLLVRHLLKYLVSTLCSLFFGVSNWCFVM